MNTKLSELFECIFFTFGFMKLIKLSNNDFKWFFTIAIHDEIDNIIFTNFFLQNSKNLQKIWNELFFMFVI